LLEEDLRITSKAGLTCIDLWSPKLDKYLATYPIAWLDMKLREYRVYPAAVSGLELAPGATQEDNLVHQAHFLETCTHMDTLGGGTIVVHPQAQAKNEEAEAKATPAQIVPWVVRALRTYSDLAAPFDVHVAFEFRSDARSTVRSLSASQEIVRQVARSNVGLSLNTLDLRRSGVKPEDLEALDVGKLKLVHLEGALPTDQSDRTSHSLPAGRGEAAMPVRSDWDAREEGSTLRRICEHLASQGFRGPYCILCPSDQQADRLVPTDQVSPLEHVFRVKQAALDLLMPLYP